MYCLLGVMSTILNIGSRFIQLLQNMYGHMYAQVKQKHKLSQNLAFQLGPDKAVI